jgi:hypothetical protein
VPSNNHADFDPRRERCHDVKLLIAVGETVANLAELPAGVDTLVDTATEILVMSPSLTSRLHWLTGDVSRARHLADDRLAAVLDQLGARGVAASGARGDELPRTAFADAVLQFSPDHILIGLRPVDRRGWQESGLLDHIVDRFGLPVTVFAVDA